MRWSTLDACPNYAVIGWGIRWSRRWVHGNTMLLNRLAQNGPKQKKARHKSNTPISVLRDRGSWRCRMEAGSHIQTSVRGRGRGSSYTGHRAAEIPYCASLKIRGPYSYSYTRYKMRIRMKVRTGYISNECAGGAFRRGWSYPFIGIGNSSLPAPAHWPSCLAATHQSS